MSRRNIIVGGAGGGLIALALSVATPEIKEVEGRRNLPYYDIVKVLTVCDGHTGPEIVKSKKYEDAECDALTTKDAKKFAEGVLRTSPHLAWHPMQLAAAISFSYNVGTGTYQKSSVARLFNEGRFIEGCNFLLRYNRAGGRVVQGLVNRRERERDICLSTLTKEGMSYVVDKDQ